jgi:hypothetical protein
VKPGWPVDVAAVAMSQGHGFDVSKQGSRGALAVVNGTVYAPFGGLAGDCMPYWGGVVAVSTTDPTSVQAWWTPAVGGGVWAPGGVSSDGTDVYIGTGNTFGPATWGGGDAVVRLSGGPTLAMASYFAPTYWPTLDIADLDMGSAPIPFDLPGSHPSALAIIFGKDSYAYLLDRNNLGGVSKPLMSLAVTVGGIITAPALYTTATATYVAICGTGSQCTAGAGDLATIKVVPGSPPTLAPSWCVSGGNGSPIVSTSDGHADAIVWQLGALASGMLGAFDGDTGAPLTFPGGTVVIPNLRRWNAPIAAKGKIYVAADQALIAFKL